MIIIKFSKLIVSQAPGSCAQVPVAQEGDLIKASNKPKAIIIEGLTSVDIDLRNSKLICMSFLDYTERISQISQVIIYILKNHIFFSLTIDT